MLGLEAHEGKDPPIAAGTWREAQGWPRQHLQHGFPAKTGAAGYKSCFQKCQIFWLKKGAPENFWDQASAVPLLRISDVASWGWHDLPANPLLAPWLWESGDIGRSENPAHHQRNLSSPWGPWSCNLQTVATCYNMLQPLLSPRPPRPISETVATRPDPHGHCEKNTVTRIEP